MNRVCLFLVVAVASLPLFAAGADRKDSLVGGWTPIKNLSDPHVQEIAQFAVSEYNKQAKKELKYEAVNKGESQVVAGTNYRLTLNVRDGTSTLAFEAVVWEKPWQHFRKLVSFKKA